MTVIDMNTAKGQLSQPPYVRYLSVLASPLLQKEIKDVSAGLTVLPPGKKSSSHAHEKETEVWVVLSGRGKTVLDGSVIPIKPQTLIVVTPGMEHQLVNDGAESLKVLWLYAPPGPEKAILENKHR